MEIPRFISDSRCLIKAAQMWDTLSHINLSWLLSTFCMRAFSTGPSPLSTTFICGNAEVMSVLKTSAARMLRQNVLKRQFAIVSWDKVRCPEGKGIWASSERKYRFPLQQWWLRENSTRSPLTCLHSRWTRMQTTLRHIVSLSQDCLNCVASKCFNQMKTVDH